jgi:hypothetical protein
MTKTMSSIRPNLVEVVTSVQRRRRWTSEQKLEIVTETNEPADFIPLLWYDREAADHKLLLLYRSD